MSPILSGSYVRGMFSGAGGHVYSFHSGFNDFSSAINLAIINSFSLFSRFTLLRPTLSYSFSRCNIQLNPCFWYVLNSMLKLSGILSGRISWRTLNSVLLYKSLTWFRLSSVPSEFSVLISPAYMGSFSIFWSLKISCVLPAFIRVRCSLSNSLSVFSSMSLNSLRIALLSLVPAFILPFESFMTFNCSITKSSCSPSDVSFSNIEPLRKHLVLMINESPVLSLVVST